MATSDHNQRKEPAGEQTRASIIKAAEKSFAEKGFDQTSVRDITRQAGCNLAAVNYHFGGKDKLYAEVFQRHFDVLREKRIAGIRKVFSNRQDPPTLEALLRTFGSARAALAADAERIADVEGMDAERAARIVEVLDHGR